MAALIFTNHTNSVYQGLAAQHNWVLLIAGQRLHHGLHTHLAQLLDCGALRVACAAGLATLDVIVRDNLLVAAQMLGASWQQDLAQLPQVRQVCGRGLLVGLLVTCAGPEVIRMFPPLNVTQAELTMAILRWAAAFAGL